MKNIRAFMFELLLTEDFFEISLDSLNDRENILSHCNMSSSLPLL